MTLRSAGDVGPLELIRKAIKDYFDDDMPTYASAIAFQALFSLFPFILFLTALLGYLQLDSFFDWLQGVALSMVPAEAAGAITEVISGLQERKGELLSFGVLRALWVASAGVRVTMKAMNAAYDVREGRPAWKLYPLSIIYTVGMAALIVVSAGLLILGPHAMGWLARQVGLHEIFVAAWTWLRWPAAFATLTLAVAVIFHVAPNVKRRFRLITPGVLLAVTGWIAASIAFKFYVNNFADYNAMYGSIGAIIVLLLYFFISAAVLLFGAEVNAAVENVSRRGKESATV
jgi:membrane protein